jgi:hypothetical protein
MSHGGGARGDVAEVCRQVLGEERPDDDVDAATRAHDRGWRRRSSALSVAAAARDHLEQSRLFSSGAGPPRVAPREREEARCGELSEEARERRRERERRRTVSIDGAMKAREWIAWMHPPLETGWMSYSVNFNPILGFGFSVGDSLRSQIRPRLFAPASVSRPALSPPDDNLPNPQAEDTRLPLFPIPESTNCPPPHHRRPWPPRKQCASAAAASEQQREKTRGIRELRSILLAAHVVEDTPLSGSPAARGGSPPPPAAPYPTLGVPSPSIRPA